MNNHTIDDYKKAIITDIKRAPYGFYIVSSLWQPNGWWACKYNGLISNGGTSQISDYNSSTIILQELTGAEPFIESINIDEDTVLEKFKQ